MVKRKPWMTHNKRFKSSDEHRADQYIRTCAVTFQHPLATSQLSPVPSRRRQATSLHVHRLTSPHHTCTRRAVPSMANYIVDQFTSLLNSRFSLNARPDPPHKMKKPIHETVTYPKITVTDTNNPCLDPSLLYEHILSCGHIITTPLPPNPAPQTATTSPPPPPTSTARSRCAKRWK